MTTQITFVANLTDLLTNTVVKQVEAQIKTLAKKIVDGKLQTEEDILKVWSTINTDFKPKKATKADKDAPQCEHIFDLKDGKPRCSGKVSLQSESKKFCSKHYRSHEQKEKAKKPKEEKKQCIYDKSGKDKKTRCKNGVCKDSQEYCSTHLKKMSEVEEPKEEVKEVVVEEEPKDVEEEPKVEALDAEEEPLETGEETSEEKPKPQKKPQKKIVKK
jgi:hypothetical protein